MVQMVIDTLQLFKKKPYFELLINLEDSRSKSLPPGFLTEGAAPHPFPCTHQSPAAPLQIHQLLQESDLNQRLPPEEMESNFERHVITNTSEQLIPISHRITGEKRHMAFTWPRYRG